VTRTGRVDGTVTVTVVLRFCTGLTSRSLCLPYGSRMPRCGAVPTFF